MALPSPTSESSPTDPASASAAVTPLRPMGGLSVSAAVDDGDSPRDVLDLLALDAFVAGRQPFARQTFLEDVAADARLLPAGARLLRETVDDDSATRLAAGDGWTIRTSHWHRHRRASINVTATDPDLAERVLLEATEDAVEARAELPDRVSIGFWHRTAHGPLRVPRDIETPRWADIRRNYPARVAAAVDRLAALRPDDVTGRLLLLHGPPGTGKTTLLRALAESWRPWCQVDCVLDPERLFADPGYLLEVALGTEVALGGAGPEGPGGRWRLLLLEDCDELIRTEAKATAGQALSRLLNLTDGLLGQGRRVVVAITTNENLASLHPAVTRPGRSLAHLEVGRLTPAEARAWLGAVPPGVLGDLERDGATLAELYALQGERGERGAVDVVEEAPAIGGYL